MRIKRAHLSIVSAVVAGTLLLAGCDQMQVRQQPAPVSVGSGGATLGPAALENESEAVPAEDVARKEAEKANQASLLSQFSDIPLPTQAIPDLNRSLILGSQSSWTGRLFLKTGYTMEEMVSFYQREMVRFGWGEVTVVRSKLSVLTFERDNRIATIQVTGTSVLSGGTPNTIVDIVVSPRGSSNNSGGSSSGFQSGLN